VLPKEKSYQYSNVNFIELIDKILSVLKFIIEGTLLTTI